MQQLTFRQVIYRLSITGVILGILANTYDVVVGSLLEAIHLLLDVIEMTLDNAVEALFNTGVHDTQTIVFYLLIAICIGFLYAIWQTLVGFCKEAVVTCSSCKSHVQTYWQRLTFIYKIIWIVGIVITTILTLMYFGFM